MPKAEGVVTERLLKLRPGTVTRPSKSSVLIYEASVALALNSGMSGNLEEDLRQVGWLRQEGRVAAFHRVRDRLTADSLIDR